MSATGKLVRVAMVVAVLGPYGIEAKGAGADGCQNVCGPSAWCGEECTEDAFLESNTTCGEYLGGWENSQCDPTSWQTCQYVCPLTGLAGDSCLENGQITTCGTYGDYAYCGDDSCLYDVEDYGSCPADCAPPSIPEPANSSDPVLTDWIDAANDILLAVTDDFESIEDADIVGGILASYGLWSEYESMPTPSPRPAPTSVATAQLESADATADRLDAPNGSTGAARDEAAYRFSWWSCSDRNGYARWGLGAALGFAAIAVAAGAATVFTGGAAAVALGALAAGSAKLSGVVAEGTFVAAISPCSA